MIYCIGHRESYERYFAEQEQPEKMGRTADYQGGSVWLTLEEALAHCPDGFAVYGVLAEWDRDTQPSADGPWHDLLVHSRLVRVA
jgi:hypothetical protein